MKKIWFVLPFYKEEKNITPLYRELKRVVDEIHCDYEFLFIDDKGWDNSLQILLDLQKEDKNIKILEFSRNFWHEIGIKAGIDHVDWDYVVIMDTDLQDPPDMVTKLYKKITSEKLDMVIVKRNSDYWIVRKSLTNLFYYIISKLSDTKIPKHVGDFRIMNRKVTDALKAIQEKSLYMKWLYAWTGFNVWEITFNRTQRAWWESAYNFTKLVWLALDWIFSFSIVPLRISTVTGIIFSLLWIYWRLFPGLCCWLKNLLSNYFKLFTKKKERAK